ncbi:hypothetical protein [Phaeobacter inhibens]|uniref:hypothetical protein n=1 Tax=Phaeobacter inhibens TaxID=221822 RepID=UPI0021A5B669|nr:hypothetical protein [Phaeobacter inhibens]UWR87832.1 hypothetical protein K4L01_13835 [Phaeobacter inhibens]
MAEKVDLGFNVNTSADGSNHQFQIRGAGIGIGAWIGLIFFGALLGIPICIFAAPDAVDFPTGIYLSVIGAFAGIAFFANLARSEIQNFAVGADYIHVGGKQYSTTDISEVMIRNKSGETSGAVKIEGGTVVVGTGISGVAMVGASALSNAASGIGQSTGAAIQESIAERGYEICFRYGKNIVPLARHLEEDIAVALFHKVSNIMQSHAQ